MGSLPEGFKASYGEFLSTIGIDAVGLARVGESVTYRALAGVLTTDRAPNLSYLARNGDCRARFDGLEVGEGKRPKTIVSCAVALDAMPRCSIAGVFARYCVCGDYHKTLRERLTRLCEFMSQSIPLGAWRICVDTAPILEREWAVRAGLGHIGFNRMLIHPKYGSHIMLGEILLEADLMDYREILAFETSPIDLASGERNSIPEEIAEGYLAYCTPGGMKCCKSGHRRCVASCPTGALSELGYDVSRCLSYWSTQHRGVVPEEMARAMGDRLWGCDSCQRDCPWTRRASSRVEGATPLSRLTFEDIFTSSGKRLQKQLAQTPLCDAHPGMVVRNACIVVANTGNAAHRDHLRHLAQNHATEWVRQTAQWALGVLDESRVGHVD